MSKTQVDEVFILFEWVMYDSSTTLAVFRTQQAAVDSAQERVKGRKLQWTSDGNWMSAGVPGSGILGGEPMNGFSIERMPIQ